MTLNSQNKVGNNTVELVITVSPDVFEAEVENLQKECHENEYSRLP